MDSVFASDLIAPCGMNCAICKNYLSYTHGVPTKRGKVSHCKGCVPRAKNCYIKRGCPKLSKHQLKSCSQCDTAPCKNLARLDKRYRERYDMSMVENLKTINATGMDGFLAEQAQKYRCSSCGGVVSVHDKKCYTCGCIEKKTGV